MYRFQMRDSRSEEKIKPRVMDFIVNDDGSQELEVKDGRIKKRILVSDLRKQMREAINKLQR